MLSRTVLLIIEFSSERFSFLWQINTEEKDVGRHRQFERMLVKTFFKLQLQVPTGTRRAPGPERERKLEVSKHADRRNELARKVVAKGYKQDDARQEGKLAVHRNILYRKPK